MQNTIGPVLFRAHPSSQADRSPLSALVRRVKALFTRILDYFKLGAPVYTSQHGAITLVSYRNATRVISKEGESTLFRSQMKRREKNVTYRGPMPRRGIFPLPLARHLAPKEQQAKETFIWLDERPIVCRNISRREYADLVELPKPQRTSVQKVEKAHTRVKCTRNPLLAIDNAVEVNSVVKDVRAESLIADAKQALIDGNDGEAVAKADRARALVFPAYLDAAGKAEHQPDPKKPIASEFSVSGLLWDATASAASFLMDGVCGRFEPALSERTPLMLY